MAPITGVCVLPASFNLWVSPDDIMELLTALALQYLWTEFDKCTNTLEKITPAALIPTTFGSFTSSCSPPPPPLYASLAAAGGAPGCAATNFGQLFTCSWSSQQIDSFGLFVDLLPSSLAFRAYSEGRVCGKRLKGCGKKHIYVYISDGIAKCWCFIRSLSMI